MADVECPDGRAPPELVGRSAELRRMKSFVGRALQSGEALLVTGAPGVGKTALLDAACRIAAAADARLLRAAGVQFEAEVSFAGLNQLFLPLHDRLEELPEPHREALRGVLGMRSEETAGQLVVSTAALALLRHTAEREPVLVVVDDAQWLDRSSARVLGFVARRLEGSRTGLLAAVRSEAGSFLLHAGLPEFEVPPLVERASAQLLDRRFPDLPAPVRRRVVSAAQGNALALLELPASMSEDQRRALVPLPPVLPLNDQLQKLFTQRVHRLPAVTRRLVLLTALDGTGELQALRGGSNGDRWLDGLAPAERDRLVRVDTTANRITFRHPLIGAAAVDLATSSERRRAHAVLADVFTDDPERRAWHLAEAAVGPDEAAAALLEVAAERALHKGDAVLAVHALLRAADLSPRSADRARRLAAAAYVGADAAGRLRSVPRLLEEARRADPDTADSLEMTTAAAHHLLNGEGDVDTAHLMLVRALENALDQGHTGSAVEEALYSLMMVCHFSGQDAPWRPYESATGRLGADLPAGLAVSSVTCGDPARATSQDLGALGRLLSMASAEVDPTRIVRAGIAAFYVDRLPACRSALRRVLESGRSGGAAGSAVQALMLLSYEAFLEGRWDEAGRLAHEGIDWSERLGYRLIAMPGIYCLALLAATRGDDSTASSLTDELMAWAAPRGVRMLEQSACHARGLAAIGRGDFNAAYREASAITPPGSLAPHVPVALSVTFDLVESAIRTGRRAVAEAHVATVNDTEIFRLRPRLAVLAAGSAAMAASGAPADRLYQEALSVRGAEAHPFELARVQLAYGEYLRRTHAPQAARIQLTRAADTFRSLGARPWVARAEHELRATGQPHRSHEASGATALTPQEYQIASLAASGLSNKQIGARLYLSPRTVSGHLYRIFPKLGISTRAALRDALNA